MNNYTVYSKTGCPYCDKISQLLEQLGLKYIVYTLDQHFDSEAFYGEFGNGSTFPQVVLDGKKLGGCSETIKYFQEQSIL